MKRDIITRLLGIILTVSGLIWFLWEGEARGPESLRLGADKNMRNCDKDWDKGYLCGYFVASVIYLLIYLIKI